MAYTKYLVTLTGPGEVEVLFVSEDIFKWINMEQDFPIGGFLTSTETVESLGFTLSELNPTEGSSPDNDRALMASHWIDDDEKFDTIAAAMEFAVEYHVDIRDAYEGVIY